ncbi:MAG: VCBS domain-containing protein, partial [Solirubrobacteraceae bacterium]|nr:VCBS domain-containing protein [Solirubrobacteraceae bacterium]
IADVDSTTLTSATIHITNVKAGDVLSASGLPAGITAAVYDPVTGILQLSGNATLAAYEAALRSIRFSNSSDTISVDTRDITITVNDGAANSNVTHALIEVKAINDAPTLLPDVNSTKEDVTLAVSASNGVLANDKDVDSPTLTVTQFAIAGIAGTFAAGSTAAIANVGSLTLNANGSYTFAPAKDYNGAVPVITYTVSDGAATSTSTLTLSVTPEPDAAVIGGTTSGATKEDVTLAASGTLTIVDPDAGQAAFVAQANIAGAHGTFNLDAAGHWTYALNNADPAVQALGQGQTLPNEVFAVKSIDGTTANVTVTISGTNDAPVAVDDVVITNVAAGQPIALASGALTRNDTDIDGNAVLGVAGSSNAVNGTVSGTNPVVFKDTAALGVTAQVQPEAPLFPNDSEANPLNNSIANAYEVARGRFGQANGADQTFLADPTLPSFKWTGRIDDQDNTPAVTDQDFIKVYLYAGEKLILDIDGADSGGTNIGTDQNSVDTLLQLYDANGALLKEVDDVAPGVGGAGSVKSGYHGNTLDAYLEHTAAADGYYYVNVTGFNNNPSGILQDDGNYELWMSIKPTGSAHPTSFDYTVSDGIAQDAGHVLVNSVQGSTLNGTAASEILVGGSGNDTIDAGAGNDWIQGGAGSDQITGGAGSDVFAWVLADRGPAGAPPTDTIKDFSIAAPNAGGDVLDLRDLLQGEAKAGTDAGNLQNYLDFDTTSTPGSTIIHV